MRLKYRLQAALQFFTFAFYPKTTLIVCLVFTVFVLAILGIGMSAVSADSMLYDLLFALTTGAVASFIVSIVVELSGNYKNNKLAWYELQDYYAAVTDYETTKWVHMHQTSAQIAKKKALDEFIAAGGIVETDEDDQQKDVVQSTWEQLPTLIPVLKRTLEDKKAFLGETEILELNSIMLDYRQIRSNVHTKLMMSPILHNVVNHPDEDFLNGSYPKNILEDIPEWMRTQLAGEENQRALDRLTDAILSDGFLLRQYMKGYEISEQILNRRSDSHGEASVDVHSERIGVGEGSERADGEEYAYDYDFSEPKDEETFRTLHDEMDRQMDENWNPSVSWHISQCCYNIAKSIDALEKSILRKPYYSIQLKMNQDDSKKKALLDPISKQVYEAEKKRLNRLLEQQKTK